MSNFTIDPYRFGPAPCGAAQQIMCAQKAWVFDGVNDYLSVADEPEFSFDAVNSGADKNMAHSISVWLKRDNVNANEALYSKGSSTSNLEYRIFFLNDDLYCDTYNNSTGAYSRRNWYNIGIATGTWFHLALGSGTELSEWDAWVNGVQLGTGSTGSSAGDMQNTTGEFKLGDMPQSGNWHYDGLMTQFIMWRDHKLTQTEVDHIYQGGNHLITPLVDCPDYQLSSKVILWISDASVGGDSSANNWTLVNNGSMVHDTVGDIPC
jgi:hypothetical protein